MAPRRAYGVDDLLKLRPVGRLHSQHDSDVVRKISSEAGIKEHVLRSSAANASDPSHLRSRNRTSSAATTFEGFEIPPADDFVLRSKQINRSIRASRDSPTSSVKRGKVERLLKEHGSPPGVRVTAGGRIVPDALSPIASPRAHQRRLAQTVPRVNPHDIPDSSILQNANGMLVNLNGQIGQIVNGQILPLQASENGGFTLYMDPLNSYPMQPPAPAEAHTAPQADHAEISAFAPNVDFASLESCKLHLRDMEATQRKWREELRELDRREVLHQQREVLPRDTKRAIVQQRIAIVNRIDDCRTAAQKLQKIIASLENGASNTPEPPANVRKTQERMAEVPFAPDSSFHTQLPMHQVPPNIPYSYPHSPAVSSYGFAMSAPLPQSQFAYGISPPASGGFFTPFVPQAPYFEQVTSRQERAATPSGLGISTLGASHENENVAPGRSSKTPTQANTSLNLDGSSREPRRSHAVAIKRPAEHAHSERLPLNPRSPSYQPTNIAPKDDQKTNAPPPFRTDGAPSLDSTVSPSTKSDQGGHARTPRKKVTLSDLVGASASEKSHCEGSECSADTLDFFPYNPRDYSSARSGPGQRRESSATHAVVREVSTPIRSTPGRSASGVWTSSPHEHLFYAFPNSPPADVFRKDFDPCIIQSSHSHSLSRRETESSNENKASDPSPLRKVDVSEQPQNRAFSTTSKSLDAKRTLSTDASHLGKPDAYDRGFRHGVEGKVDEDSTNFEYLRGWRDGTVASKRSSTKQASSPLSRRSSGEGASTSKIPRGPVNTPAPEPLQSASPRHPDYPDSVQRAFQSRANISLSRSSESVLGTNPSTARKYVGFEQLSPLSQRHSASQKRTASTPALVSHGLAPNSPLGVNNRGLGALSLVSPGLATKYDGSGSDKSTEQMMDRSRLAGIAMSPTHAEHATSPTRSPSRAISQTSRSPTKRITSSMLSAVGLKDKAPLFETTADPESPTKKSRNWRDRLGQLSPKSARKYL